MKEAKEKLLPVPNYERLPDWELYSSSLMEEYTQSIDEGLDIAGYKALFQCVSLLPKGETKEKLGDVLFDIVLHAGQRPDYPYREPSDLASIQCLRKPYKQFDNKTPVSEKQLLGAWFGRVAGCMLGKTVEGIRTDESIPFLKETNNYPLRRYIRKADVDRVDVSKYKYPLTSRPFADTMEGMPADDDTNYTVLAQEIIEEYGREFAPLEVAQAWLKYQPKDSYCTAERVAFCNFIKGYHPPHSAVRKNAYREWIGAQIRTDYYGYINPGQPELAAEMAWRDASISHVKNGIYGAMFVSAMLAIAAVTRNVEDILLGGLAQIPHTSRLYEDVMRVYAGYQTGLSKEACFAGIHGQYDEHTDYGWCHTNPNAMIVAACLLYGSGDYGSSICMAVETGFDTDCNGATVGSILGMANGIDAIPDCWTAPFGDTLHTTIFGMGTVKISEVAMKTLKHIR